MGFVDTAKTKLFGDQNNRQDHGFRAGFVPTIAPSLVVAGAVAMGAPAGAVALALAGAGAGAVFAAAGAAVAAVAVAAGTAVAVAAGTGAAVAAVAAAASGVPVALVTAAVAAGIMGVFAADAAKKKGYNFRRYLAGAGAGCVAGAALAFNVTAGHLPQEQPKAPVAGPVPSTLEIKPSGGSLCEDFKIADSEMTDKQGRKVYTLFVPQDCSLVPNP